MVDVEVRQVGGHGHQDWAQRRRAVLERHPDLSTQEGPLPQDARRDPLNLNGKSIRQHDLWKRFADQSIEDKDLGASSNADLEHTLAAASLSDRETNEPPLSYEGLTKRFFSPVYIQSEQTLRCDHSWNYAGTDLQQLPADAVRNPYLEGRFSEYPKLRRLVELKRSLVDQCAAPPTYLCADLKDSTAAPPHPSSAGLSTERFHLATLVPVKYDVVLIDPPLATYEWNSVPSASNRQAQRAWSWDEISELPIPLLAAKESFVFLWVGPGSSDGLERGRECLSRWGYRRCEVITWCLTSRPEGGNSTRSTGEGAAFATSSVHCLMGIRGTIKRSTDSNFVHCNVDTDVLFWPGESSTGNGNEKSGSIDLRKKPPELYSIIENFCLGTRRVELFGNNRNIRRGWLTIGHPETLGPNAPGWSRAVNQEDHPGSAATDSAVRLKGFAPEEYHKERYDCHFQKDPAGCQLKDRANVVPFDDTVDKLRPRSPNAGRGDAKIDSPRPGMLGPGQGNMPWNRKDHLPRGLGYTTSGPRSRQEDQQQAGSMVAPHAPRDLSSSGGNQQMLSPLPPTAGTLPGPAVSPSAHPSRSPTAGLGAGGPVTVSVPSGSDTLSGPQKSAIGLGLAAAQQRRAGAEIQGASASSSGRASPTRGRGGSSSQRGGPFANRGRGFRGRRMGGNADRG